MSKETSIPVRKVKIDSLSPQSHQMKSVVMPDMGSDGWGSRGNGLVIGLIIIGALALGFVFNQLYIHSQVQKQVADAVASSNPAMTQSLTDLAKQKALSVDSNGDLVLNGQLTLNNAAVLNPSDAPSSPSAGQLYLNRTDGLIYYYNGTQYLALATQTTASTLGATSGSDTGLVAPGVMSLQGLTGKLALLSGGGIAVNGLSISNTGVTSIHAGTGVSVSGITGNVTISLPQDIGHGATPSFTGLALVNALGVGYGGTGAADSTGARLNLSAAKSGGNSDITSLSGLTTALSVSQGGTGQVNFALGGILVGNGTNGVDLITSPSPGKCLISNNGSAPSFQNCPGSSGSVTTGNPQTTGRLTKFDTINNQIIDSRIEESGHTIIVYGQIIGADTSDSTSAMVIQNSVGTPLLVADTTNMKVTVLNLELTGHFITGGGSPTASPTINAGASGSCTVSGTDTIGLVTINTGVASVSANNMCDVSLSSAFSGSTPHVVLSPANRVSAELVPYATMTGTGGFSVGVSVVPPASSTYKFEYFVAQ